MLPIHTILHPTDFSAHSDYAFRLACSIARDHGARVIVLHVVDRPVLAYPGVMTPPPPPVFYGEQRDALRQKLEQIKPRAPGVAIEHLLIEANPAAAIVTIAEEQPCDLIVMGTHGRTGLTRLVLGSVAEQVVRSADCPVLTVKTPQRSAPPNDEVAAGEREGATAVS
jgi:nucleotide-binding universal stress UspA family protein